jgi:sugar O-acyltransferase (sialic acid O-acetyltransferase NeuD family)
MEKPVIIFGANPIGTMALEIFSGHGIEVFGFLDDRASLAGTAIMDVPVLGGMSDEQYLKLIGKKCGAFVATDNNAERKAITAMLTGKRKVMPVNAIHSHSRIAGSAHVEHGTFINDSVVIGARAKIGSHCLIHAGAVVNFGAILGNFVQVGSGSVIGDEVKAGNEVFIGAGAVIVPGLTIGDGARIGAGSVVVEEVGKGQTVFGNPAKVIHS